MLCTKMSLEGNKFKSVIHQQFGLPLQKLPINATVMEGFMLAIFTLLEIINNNKN